MTSRTCCALRRKAHPRNGNRRDVPKKKRIKQDSIDTFFWLNPSHFSPSNYHKQAVPTLNSEDSNLFSSDFFHLIVCNISSSHASFRSCSVNVSTYCNGSKQIAVPSIVKLHSKVVKIFPDYRLRVVLITVDSSFVPI